MQIKDYKRGLSHTEQAIYFSCLGKEKTLVSLDYVEKEHSLSRGHAKKILHNLAKKQAAYRLGKGLYAIVPPDVMASKNTTVEIIPIIGRLMETLGIKYYLAFQTAAYLHGAVNQIPFVVQLAVKKQKRPILIMNTEIKFFTTKNIQFFGIERIKYGNYYLHVSDKEKTVLDCLDRYKLCGGLSEVINTIKDLHDEIDLKKLIKYSDRYSYALRQRLGLILEKLRTGKKLLKHLRISKNSYLFDRYAERKGKLNERWNVIDNVGIF